MNTTNSSTHIFGNDDRPVFRIIVYCLSLAFSVLIASLETIRPATSAFTFEFSWRTLLTFLIGAAIVVPCFRTIFLSPHIRRRIVALAMVVMIGLSAFLYPLRFVPAHKYAAIFTGLAIAVATVTLVGGILFTINRFLNADELATQSEKHAALPIRLQGK